MIHLASSNQALDGGPTAESFRANGSQAGFSKPIEFTRRSMKVLRFLAL